MSPRRSLLLVALAAVPATAALPVAAQAGGGSRAKAAASATVTLKDISFKKSRVTITRGSRVTWVWKDGDTPHNVTSRKFKSSTTKHRGRYTVRFTRKGVYTYHCTIHPGMNGTVVVR